MVISGDPTICGLLSSRLASHHGSRALVLEKVDDALRVYEARRPEFVVLDVERSEDLAALEQFRRIDRDIPILAVSTHASAVRVVEAMKLGAADVLSAPFEPKDVDAAIGNMRMHRRSTREMAGVQPEVRTQDKHTMLFGSGDAMAELRRLIDQVVDVDVSVLIQGETGTGKELVARALAAPWLRRGKPFVKVNCAALPGELFEAELFGFERGAFTGAIQAKPGKFEIADGGTIFLDEIGELTLHLQSKLLQVLQDGHFSRVGGRGEIHPIVRVIAATNRDLRQAVVEGRFREDLLFRLNVIPLYVPPLRERRDDIPLLAEFFSKRWAAFYHRPYAAISSEMMGECLQYHWPGNIRELENLMQRTVVLGTETPVRQTLCRNAIAATSVHSFVESPVRDRYSLKQAGRLAARQAEATLITQMLQRTRGNRKQAAINLGVCYKAFLHKARASGCC